MRLFIFFFSIVEHVELVRCSLNVYWESRTGEKSLSHSTAYLIIVNCLFLVQFKCCHVLKFSSRQRSIVQTLEKISKISQKLNFKQINYSHEFNLTFQTFTWILFFSSNFFIQLTVDDTQWDRWKLKQTFFWLNDVDYHKRLLISNDRGRKKFKPLQVWNSVDVLYVFFFQLFHSHSSKTFPMRQ